MFLSIERLSALIC